MLNKADLIKEYEKHQSLAQTELARYNQKCLESNKERAQAFFLKVFGEAPDRVDDELIVTSDNVVLRYQNWNDEQRFQVVETCPDCGARLLSVGCTERDEIIHQLVEFYPYPLHTCTSKKDFSGPWPIITFEEEKVTALQREINKVVYDTGYKIVSLCSYPVTYHDGDREKTWFVAVVHFE